MKLRFVVSNAEPTWMITITQVPSNPWEARGKMKIFLDKVFKPLSPDAAIAYAYHRNPNETFDYLHVHGFYRGPQLSVEMTSAIAVAAGLGERVDIRPLDANGYGYIWKPLIAASQLPRMDAEKAVAEWNALNSRRRAFTKGKFWRNALTGKPSNLDTALRTELRRHQIAMHADDSPQDWT